MPSQPLRFAYITLIMSAFASVTTSSSAQSPIAISPGIDYFPTPASSRKGVTLVVHGLNTKPTAMLEIISLFNIIGMDAYLLTLSGHSDKVLPISSITASAWEADIANGYAVARKAATDASVPLYFAGYSFGALLAQHLMMIDSNATFDRQILMAPATAMRDRSKLIRALFFLNEDRTLPSYTPIDYRANQRLPLKAYKIMFRMEKDVHEHRFKNANIPTLILIDRHDELVSLRKLKRFKEKFDLTNQEIAEIEVRGGSYHHMIFTQTNTGIESWRLLMQKVSVFLDPNAPSF